MQMSGQQPKEVLPAIGTVANPAMFFDGYNLLVSYEVAPVAGGGTAILEFAKVICFEQSPINIEGLSRYAYPVSAWNFTEVFGSDRTEYWGVLNPRFWTISFNDLTIEVVFETVRKVFEDQNNAGPVVALINYLREHHS